MIKEAIGVAATVDEARKMAVENLHAPIDADVKVEIITFPKKKVLGLFGGSDAKVKASYDVKVGDVLEIAFGTRTVKAQVLNVAEVIKKDDAALLYKLID